MNNAHQYERVATIEGFKCEVCAVWLGSSAAREAAARLLHGGRQKERQGRQLHRCGIHTTMPQRKLQHGDGDPSAISDALWNNVHSLPQPRSLQKPYHPGDHPRRTELSAISDAPRHGILPGYGTRMRPQPNGTPSLDTNVNYSSSDNALPPIDARLNAQAMPDEIDVGRSRLQRSRSSVLPSDLQRRKPGARPSNRSEAAQLACDLSRRLKEVKRIDAVTQLAL